MKNHIATEAIRISVIVCTYNRSKILRFCLDTLVNQTADKSLFEIIVVNNNSTDNTQSVAEEYASIHTNFRVVFEARQGLSIARNRGYMEARYEWVSYIDDDAKVSDDYIERAIEIISLKEPDIFGGPYFPYYVDEKPKWFLDKYETVELGEARMLSRKEFLNGTNILFNKNLLGSLGCFDAELGMTGNKIAYGEETSLQIIAWDKKNDLKVFYSPELKVYHLATHQKMTLVDKLLRSYKMGYSQTYLWIRPECERKAHRNAPFELIKIILLFIVKEPFNLIFRKQKSFAFPHNYIYEKWPKYFKSFGQEWRLIKDLIKVK